MCCPYNLDRFKQVENRAYYFDSNLCIEYDPNSKVSFIEVSCGDPEGMLIPTIYGEDVTKRDTGHIFQILSEKNNGEIDDSENGYSYLFYNLSVGVYREITPNDYTERVDEMKANGVPVEDNPDLNVDFWKATHWATIGIGISNYYRCV